ncbi:MAG: helix-turn-helix transcriptional regulator [Lachnospiraceae bacterium]|nr:helix-turn-helix transcriptional regulator [Lachnospiraceae bacterium]
MYKNLDAEMARAQITKSRLAEQIGVTPTTLCMKLNGKSDLTLPECVKIKKILGVELPIEFLFHADDSGEEG